MVGCDELSADDHGRERRMCRGQRADESGTGSVHVALLRAINVGGTKKLLMAELRAMFEAAGCADVRTYIQSGNVVFRAEPALAARIPGLIEAEIADTKGFQVPVVTRTAAELHAVVRGNPFLAAGADPAQLHVGFLADAAQRITRRGARSGPLAARCLRGARTRGLPALSERHGAVEADGRLFRPRAGDDRHDS